MNKMLKHKWFTIVIFVILVLGSLEFVTIISKMAFENTCVELQEQYIKTEVKEEINSIENSINFGKELKNYYGMEEVIQSICDTSKGNLKVAILNEKGNPLYLSFKENGKNIDLLSKIYETDYQKEVNKVTKVQEDGKKIALGEKQSIVFPIYKDGKQRVGHLLVIYKQKDLIEASTFVHLEKIKWMIWALASVALLLFFLIKKDDEEEKEGKKQQYFRFVPIVLIMISMFAYILLMYQSYEREYTQLVEKNAQSTANYIRGEVEDVVNKGLKVDEIARVSDYLNQKVENNIVIESISIEKNYYDTADKIKGNSSSILKFDIMDHQARLSVVVNKSYISEKVQVMMLTFGAVFIICLMITYELTHLAEVISLRSSRNFNQENKEQMGMMGVYIKLLSFLTYTAIYTSMSYTAVILRNWDVTMFGFTKEVTASMPLTVELLCILLSSVLLQSVFAKMKLRDLGILTFSFLIFGNFACTLVKSPYLLLFLRAFCGIGFGMLKYWLNAIVAVGSMDTKAIGKNYANLNAGLLGGITVGASLGSILAQSLGYQFNYCFTAILDIAILVFAMGLLPWKLFWNRRKEASTNTQKQSGNLGKVLKNRSVLKSLLLGAVPLNIGLMYVVAFLPVYMNNMGQPTVVTSYAYLVNGLCGVYIGVAMMEFLKRFSPKMGSVFALAMAGIGILVLVFHSSVLILLISAGIMGLFDGYGTPMITSFFTSLPSVQKADTASMLTVFNGVGSFVQILCPLLYNLLIQPDGKTSYLFIFSLCYLAVAVLFLFAFRKKDLEVV